MSSYWLNSTKEKKQYKELSKNIEVEVCIIGGGITGITTAYYLSEKGKKVAILEKDRICEHTTGKTTGKITSQHGLFYEYLINSKGKEYAKKYLEANENAIRNIENIIKKEKIRCDLKEESAYVFTQKEEEISKIMAEINAVNSLGKEAKFKKEIQIPIQIKGAIEFKKQAQFHPVKYAYGLCEKIIKNGSKIYENTKAINTEKEDDKYIITTENNNKVKAKYLIIATRFPIKIFPGYYSLKMYQSSSYAIVVDPKEELIGGIYINSEIPQLSFRTIQDGNKKLLQIVGFDYKTGKQELEDGFRKLEELAYSIYPKAQTLYRWIVEDCITLDKIPYIGEFSNIMKNMYVATGFNKWGITTSDIAANIITDEILNKENPYKELFYATRVEPIKNRKEVKNIVKEAVTSIALKKLELPKETVESISEEEEKIVEYNGTKVGIYKNEEGKIFMVKPICTHLGCELSFNITEKTWDCPCHGSRFTYEGKSIEPPSIKDLDD